MDRRFLVWPLVLGLLSLGSTGGRSAHAAPEAGQSPPPTFQRVPEAGPAGDADGRFLILTGQGNFSIPLPTKIQLGFDKNVGEVQVYVFDADTDGMWDQRSGDQGRVLVAPTITYQMFADPLWYDATQNAAALLNDGNPATNPVLLDTVSSTDPVIQSSGDDSWIRMFRRAPDASAFDPLSQRYHYLFCATMQTVPVNNGLEACGYKLALNGIYQLNKDTLLGFTGGVVDARADALFGPDFTEYSADMTPDYGLRNEYDGTFEFTFDTRGLCSDLELWESDADWNVAIPEGQVAWLPTDPSRPAGAPALTGIPPDDGGLYRVPQRTFNQDSSLLKISPAIEWRLLDPDGNVVFTSQANASNGHPSVSSNPVQAESEKTTVLPQATLRAKPGLWRWEWRGVDARNFVFIKSNLPLGTIPAVPTARGVVFCDEDEDGVADANELGIPGVKVTLQRLVNGVPSGNPLDAVTNASGVYTLDVPEATYRVTTDVTAFTATTPLPATFAVDLCEGGRLDIGYRCRGQVCGKVFCDADGDGRYTSPPDSALGGTVTVRLQRIVNGLPVETVDVQTTGNLDYCANDLRLGEWSVSVVPSAVTQNLQPTTAQPRTATLTLANPKNLAVDFGYLCLGRIEGRVFCDFDEDGVFDVGSDEPLANVQVGFVPANPLQPAFTKTTDADGLYGSDVAPGQWTVSVLPNQPALVGATALTATSVQTTVAPGETKVIDFRYQCKSSLEGTVFREPLENCNGLYNPPGDVGIAGVTVLLEMLDGQGFPIAGSQRQTVTDGAGFYRFNDLMPGPYRVQVGPGQAVLANLKASSALVLTPTVPSKSVVKDQNFGYCPLPSISGTVFREKDGRSCDGVQQPDEAGIAGVTVNLWKAATPPPAAPFKTTATNASGDYTFPNLEPGSYILRVADGQPVLLNLFPSSATTLSPILLPNANVTGQDFGYCPYARLRVTVWREADGRTCDGVRQPDEGPIAGVQVSLVGVAPVRPPQVALTNASGVVDFTNLEEGTWRVEVPGNQPVLVNLDPSTATTVDVSLLPGDAKNVEVGFCPRGALQGRVFREANGRSCDGVWQQDEAGIAGVTVDIVGINPVRPPAVDVTDAQGLYSFDNLMPGTYRVTVAGGQPVLVDLTPSTPLQVDATVLPGETKRVDFGFCPPGVIRGYVFREANGRDCDGVRQPDEGGIAGVTVRLVGVAPVRPPVLDVTDASGFYEFPNLPEGLYSVSVDGNQPVLVNLSASTPLTVPVALLPGQTKDVDFGFCPLGRIEGIVFREANGRSCDGVWQQDEAGIPGVTVRLLGVNPVRPPVLDVTDAAGRYEFPGLPEGQYLVSVDGAQPVLVNLTPSTPLSVPVTLLPGETREVDFGFCPPGVVRGYVFRNANLRDCDSVRQGDEAGIPGVLVSIVGTAPVRPPVLDLTDGNGFYEFTNLPEGAYLVSVAGNQPVLVNLTPSSPLEVPAAVLPGTTEEIDFGFCPPGRIAGVVYRNSAVRDCDDERQADEVGIPGVLVTLTGIAPVLPPVVDVTDLSGRYEFANLPAGFYEVKVDGSQPVLVNLTPSTPLTVPATVLPGETREIDFGLCPPGRVQGYVFREANGRTCDGVRQADEAGIGGVTVTLTGISPVRPPRQTVTLASGFYQFSDVAEGIYTVAVPGGQPQLLNLTPSTPLSVTFELPPNSVEEVDFGFCPPSEIRGVVYRGKEGRDCDDVRQPDEAGIPGVQVTLTGVAPARPLVSTTTNALGQYAFVGLAEGSWMVQVDGSQPVLVNLTPGTPLDVGVTLLPGELEIVDFGFCPPGRIRGRVYLQPGGPDCDDVFTPGVDEPAAGVLVTLELPGGGLRATATDANGFYEFADLPEGLYAVTVDGASAVLLYASPAGPTTAPVTVLPGQTSTYDFPFCRQSLSGHVFREPRGNCDGVRGPLDAPIAGVVVRLIKVDLPDAGLTLEALTDAAGFYAFPEIPAGAYEVSVAGGQPVLVNLTPSTPTVLTPVVLPGAVVTDQDFGYCPPELRKLCGWVFREPVGDCDGVREPGTDVGIAGVEVALQLEGDDAIYLQTTDATGRYCFTDLAPGVYRVFVPGQQPEVVNLVPSSPSELLVPVPEATDVDDVDFGYCSSCQDEPCCEGDLHEVVTETEIFVGDCVPCWSLCVKFFACCDGSTTALDTVSLDWRGAFPGPAAGLGEILTVESLTVQNGVARIRIRITAAGPHFKCGYFGGETRKISVCLNGKTNSGCAPFRCESIRPGGRFTWTPSCGPIPPCDEGVKVASWVPCGPSCPAKFFVLRTTGYETWKNCTNPPPCNEPPPPCGGCKTCPPCKSCPKDCKPCEGGVTSLTLRYQGSKKCKVRVEDKKGRVLYEGRVGPYADFTFAGKGHDGTMGDKIRLCVDGGSPCWIDTSCKEPLGTGLTRGHFKVTDGSSRKGGKFCPLPSKR